MCGMIQKGTCLKVYLHHTQLIILRTSSKDVQECVIYSDCCTYHNQNAVLANTLPKTVVDNDITVVQNYLERGHSKKEVDSIYSLVETKVKRKPIYVPQFYVKVITESTNICDTCAALVLQVHEDVKPVQLHQTRK